MSLVRVSHLGMLIERGVKIRKTVSPLKLVTGVATMHSKREKESTLSSPLFEGPPKTLNKQGAMGTTLSLSRVSS